VLFTGAVSVVDRITVRMYEVGFGDCFLLTFWSGAKAARVLVDCGSITEGKAQVARVAADVIAACTEAGRSARIDLVVATHRHKDHVSGFSDPAWSSVEVGEVWMPWTEDPTDPQATRIRNRQSAFALSLLARNVPDEPLAVQADASEPQSRAMHRAWQAMALNALTNEAAMTTLHRGFAGRPKRHFLPVKKLDCEARSVEGLPGVTIHVLGPTRDEKTIAKMNPPDGAAYLRASAGGRFGLRTEAEPAFGYEWQVGGSGLNSEDRKSINDLAEQPEGLLAAAIDNAVNNTSLILVFEVADAVLLFPGDAQWGTWNAVLENPKAQGLLGRTTFYKVGHHGSHNATPRKLIEEFIRPHSTTMVSTKPVRQWPDVPRKPLIEALASKGHRIARTDDEKGVPKGGFRVSPGLYIEHEIKVGG
jgi:beta-lactamase superfamily II metal-dependent hydrolase